MSTPRVVVRTASVSRDSYTLYNNKPTRGIVLHHTADTQTGPLPFPHLGGSWQRLFAPDGTIYYDVPVNAAAHHVLMTDRWRPSWVLRGDGRVSDMNYSSLGYEIQYAPQAPYKERPTPEQYASLRWQLAQDYKNYGVLPVVGHGEVDSGRWPTEPHDFDWTQAGFGPKDTKVGRIWAPTPTQNTDGDMLNPTSLDVIKGWLESAGQPVNMDTAIMKFAADAFQQGPPPYGNWRGPALPPGEYTATTRDGRSVVRHRFTAGVAEYDPTTGGLGWVEAIAHPEDTEVP